MNDVSDEWKMPTLSSLVVTTNTYCPPSHPQVVLERQFYGSELGCNCLGIYAKYMNGDNTLIKGAVCDRNQTKNGCINIKPINPIKMG
jgi:hypothetical protein